MTLVAPSILSADFSRLGDEIRAVEAAGADWIHIDVMDGHFVPNITIGPGVVKDLRPSTELPFDVHLMIAEPEHYIQAFAEAGADIVTVHAEAADHLHRLIGQIHDAGCKAGVSLNPGSPLSLVENVVSDLDLLLVMTVNPGFGGQSFIASMLPKIEQASHMIGGRDVYLQVDGGVDDGNIGILKERGVDVVVAGSAVFGTSDYAAAIKKLK
ncbi:MAG: ribulose-phosphate 3-epimerase [Thermoplasmatota archaeon]